MSDDDALMTLAEACRFLPGATLWSLEAAYSAGRLPFYRVGKLAYVKRGELEQLAGLDANVFSRVYVVGYGPYVKIGFTAGLLRARLSQLQTPEPLTIHAEICAPAKLERMLHRRFAQHRLNGEWFRLRGTLKKWIDAGCPL